MAISKSFERDGYLLPLDILSPQEVQYYQAMYDRLESRIGKEAAAIGVLQKHLEDPDIWNLATHPRVLDAAQQALGDDVVLIATHFFTKYPDAKEQFVAWHQDVTYWGLEPAKAITVWLAIDDADVENGCMRVIPGSHHRGQLPHGKSTRSGNLLSVNQEIPHDLVDESQAIDCPLKAGQASLHDGLTIHGSNPNRSSRRRCGLTIRFVPPHVRLVGDLNSKTAWKPMLVRGTDRFNHIPLVPFPSFARQTV